MLPIVDSAPRWRIVIVDDHERSRLELRAAIESAGGQVSGEAGRCAEAPLLVQRLRPDAAVVAVGLADGDGVDVAASLAAGDGCPVVLFTSRSDERLSARARRAGVMAYLLKPLRAAEVAPTVDLAIARFRETSMLRRKLQERTVLERAKGLLMQRYGLSEEDAFQRLRRTAMDRRRPMAEIARTLLSEEALARLR